MSVDLGRVLKAEAPKPREPLNLGQLESRASRYHRNRFLLIGIAAVALVIAAPLGTISVLTAGDQKTTPGAQENCISYTHEADLRLFLSSDASAQEINNLMSRVLELEYVDTIYYISSEEALREFKDIHRKDPEVFETLQSDSLPHLLAVHLTDDTKTKLVKEALPPSEVIEIIRIGESEFPSTHRIPLQVLPPTICLRATTPGANED